MYSSAVYYFKYLLEDEGDSTTYEPNLEGDVDDDCAEREAEAAGDYRREFPETPQAAGARARVR